MERGKAGNILFFSSFPSTETRWTQTDGETYTQLELYEIDIGCESTQLRVDNDGLFTTSEGRM